MACRAYRWPKTREEVLALVAPVLARYRTSIEAAAELGCTDSALRGLCRNHGLDLPSLLQRPPSPGAVAYQAPAFASREEEPSRIAAPVVPLGREITVGLAGDLHDPEIDKGAWHSFMRWTAEAQPEVLVLTELFEWPSMSAHNGGNWGSLFEDDCASARRRLAQIRSVNRNAEIVLLEANHDTRLERMIAHRIPQLTRALTIPRAVNLDDFGVRWVPEEQSFRVGTLKVIHGHQMQPNPDKGMLPENACKRALQRFGEPGWTVVFFHTHRRGYWSERHDCGTYEAVNLPCLRTLRPEWHRGSVMGHAHGFGIANVGPSGQTNLYSVGIENGSFSFGGRRYAA